MSSSSPPDDVLHEALAYAQRLGMLGPRPIAEVIAHARGFLPPLDGVTGVVVDLGSGGGVPGLVIAHDRPDLSMVLVDRRTKRTDVLSRLVRRLGWGDRVEVVAADVAALAAERGRFAHAAVARGFGPPSVTLSAACTLVRPGGRVVVSEPPDGDRWEPELLDALGVERLPSDTSMAAFAVR